VKNLVNETLDSRGLIETIPPFPLSDHEHSQSPALGQSRRRRLPQMRRPARTPSFVVQWGTSAIARVRARARPIARLPSLVLTRRSGTELVEHNAQAKGCAWQVPSAEDASVRLTTHEGRPVDHRFNPSSSQMPHPCRPGGGRAPEAHIGHPWRPGRSAACHRGRRVVLALGSPRCPTWSVPQSALEAAYCCIGPANDRVACHLGRNKVQGFCR